MRKMYGVWILSFVAVFVLSFNSYAELPSYTKICSVMQNISGWTVENKCDGTNMSGTSVGDVVVATKTFTKGKKRLEVSVMSGMQAMMNWGIFQSNISIETNNNVMKTMKIQGYHGGVSYDKTTNGGFVYVCLKENNGQCGVLFGIQFENMGYKDAVDLAKNYNLKDIEEIFK